METKQHKVQTEQELIRQKARLEHKVRERTRELQRTLAELKESEKKYRTLVETMSEGVVVVNNDDKIEFVNSTFCRQFGYKSGHLTGKHAMEVLLDKDERDRMKKIISERKKGRFTRYEMQMKTRSGRKLWMLVNSAPIYDDHGNVTGSVSLHTNITHRKQYEVDLDALARFAAENPSPVMRFSIHRQEFIYVNKSARYLVDHFNNEKGIYKKWITIINKVYKKNRVEKEELRVLDRAYLFTIVPVRVGRYINLYGTDITATKQAEEEVKRLLFVLSQTDNAVMIADADGRIQWVNAAFQRISGYLLNEVKGTHGEKLRRGKRTGLDTRHSYFRKMLKTRQSVSYESKNYTREGKVYWSLTTITPVLDKNGCVESIVAVDTDVTEKKKAERAMLRAKKMAEESVKAKELFLANMSHEIRTPMNGIMGIIQLLRETPLDRKQENYLRSMEFAGENLLRIIDDVLDLSKIESGKMSIEKIGFSVTDMVNDVVSSISHRASEKNIELKLEIAGDIPAVVVGDPVRINQILLNLISNAIKFTDEGWVKLCVSRKSGDKEKCVLRFTVKDTGIGVPKAMQKKIFKEFEQAHKGTTRKYGGTGLGLSIVKRLTTLMNGSLEMRSRVKEGTEFTVDLPFDIIRTAFYVKEKKAAVNLKEKLEHKKVLLVEDNMLNQMVASDFLSSMGASVHITHDGQEAVNMLVKETFDVVLMDIQMPGMDGYEATRKIRNELKSNVPIIAMTAHAIHGEEYMCRAAGMNDYISKPLRKTALCNKIIQLTK